VSSSAPDVGTSPPWLRLGILKMDRLVAGLARRCAFRRRHFNQTTACGNNDESSSWGAVMRTSSNDKQPPNTDLGGQCDLSWRRLLFCALILEKGEANKGGSKSSLISLQRNTCL
jgi:hypothetical protein